MILQDARIENRAIGKYTKERTRPVDNFTSILPGGQITIRHLFFRTSSIEDNQRESDVVTFKSNFMFK